ncbi:unnamed protein product [Thelazia callipaeda]|uniref:ATPase_AAA_core domain-containing protein n=1 Tax=Thelazia callipaeda TaxID=103827 RepID=A0A0N5CS81_THECL|nr:unnamed protein product [Thelazia callipaeda]
MSLKPILLNSNQRATRSIVCKVKKWRTQHVRFCSETNICHITPRSEKIPGVVKMPNSPPITTKDAANKFAGDCIALDEPEIILNQTVSMSEEESIMISPCEGVRFLPVETEVFECRSNEEVSPEDIIIGDDQNEGRVPDETVMSINILAPSDAENMNIETKIAVHAEKPSLTKIAGRPKRTKQRDPIVVWVRGGRLRNRSEFVENKEEENKENLSTCASNESGDVKDEPYISSISLIKSRVPLAPCAGPLSKVKQWLNSIPDQKNNIMHGTDMLEIHQQQVVNESEVKVGAFDALDEKQLSCESGKISNSQSPCCQRKLVKSSSLPVHVQVITERTTEQCQDEEVCPTNITSTHKRQKHSSLLCKPTADHIDVGVVCCDSQFPSNDERTKLREKIGTENLRQTSEALIENYHRQKTSNRPEIHTSSHKFKAAFASEMDFTPFPDISHVGYTNIAPVKYDFPYKFREASLSLVSSTDYIEPLKLLKKFMNNGENMMKNNITFDPCEPPKFKNRKKRRFMHLKRRSSTQEFQHNIWSEGLRPINVDEFITDDNKKRDRGKRLYSSSRDHFDLDEEEQLCNTAIVCGQYGTGKTSLVYAVARSCGMQVLELASNEKRSGFQIKSKLLGATHSYKFSVAATSSMFSEIKEETNAIRDSIILIDDCDVFYEKYDDGFWPALRTLCKEARTPVIVICEDIRLIRQELTSAMSVPIFTLSRLSVQTATEYLMELCTFLHVTKPSDACFALVKQYNSDLRACINHLQFYMGNDENNLSTVC